MPLNDYEPDRRGQWLQRERKALGLHQHDVAAELGINQGRICEWENLQKPMPDAMYRQLVDIMNRKRDGN